MVLGYFSALPYSFGIESLDATGASASTLKRKKINNLNETFNWIENNAIVYEEYIREQMHFTPLSFL